MSYGYPSFHQNKSWPTKIRRVQHESKNPFFHSSLFKQNIFYNKSLHHWNYPTRKIGNSNLNIQKIYSLAVWKKTKGLKTTLLTRVSVLNQSNQACRAKLSLEKHLCSVNNFKQLPFELYLNIQLLCSLVNHLTRSMLFNLKMLLCSWNWVMVLEKKKCIFTFSFV